MRILLISNLYEPYSKGGAERVTQTVAEELIQQGRMVRVLTAKPAFSGKKYEIVNGVKVQRFFPPNVCWYGNVGKLPAIIRILWHVKDMCNPMSYVVTKKMIKYFKPDIVMTHNLKGIGYSIPKAIKKAGVWHVHTVHDVQLVIPSGLLIYGEEHTWQQRTVLRKWYEAFAKHLFGSPDTVIYPSKFLKEFYEKRDFFPRSQKIVLQNPTDIVIQEHTEKPLTDTLELLYIGQLEPHKGISWFANIFSKWRAESKRKAHLTIVGSGSEYADLQKLYCNNTGVTVQGKIKHTEVAKVLQKAHMLVVPSLCYENTPTVILEAHAAGIPVLASRIGGIPELVDEKAGDILITAGNEKEIQEVLQRITEERLHYLGVAHLNNVQEYVERLVNLIEDNGK